jgi:hypothetical protein
MMAGKLLTGQQQAARDMQARRRRIREGREIKHVTLTAFLCKRIREEAERLMISEGELMRQIFHAYFQGR